MKNLEIYDEYFYFNQPSHDPAQHEKNTIALLECSFDTFAQTVEKLSEFISEVLELNSDNDLTIGYIDNDQMSSLHEQWMGLSGPTDVMSLPMDHVRPGSKAEPPQMLGDIVISPDVAAIQAKIHGHSLNDELLLLQTHGILHLCGYDHQRAEEKKEMFEIQDRVLSQFLGRPGPQATEDWKGIDQYVARTH